MINNLKIPTNISDLMLGPFLPPPPLTNSLKSLPLSSSHTLAERIYRTFLSLNYTRLKTYLKLLVSSRKQMFFFFLILIHKRISKIFVYLQNHDGKNCRLKCLFLSTI